MHRSLLFSLVPLVLLTGCESCEKKPTPTTTMPAVADAASPSASAAPDPLDAATAAVDSGAKLDMGNCPTSVPGSAVALKDVEGGIEVTITGKDEEATKEIRDRSKKLVAAASADAGPSVKHDHSGSGGGRTGRCTIIMRNTKLALAETPKGVTFTVKALEKSELDWLRRETKERDKEAKSASSEGAGTQRMANCPSAIEGTKTTVKDSKEGAIITITGPADKVADIRGRTKHTVEVAKKGEAARMEHTGSGTGGGGLGRCPIVVEGETTVEMKEIEGGVEVEVKTKKDVAALQKDVKSRAAFFAH